MHGEGVRSYKGMGGMKFVQSPLKLTALLIVSLRPMPNLISLNSVNQPPMLRPSLPLSFLHAANASLLAPSIQNLVSGEKKNIT